MATVSSLQTQDTALRKQFTANPKAVKSAQIDVLLVRVQQTGKMTGNIQEREQLLQILRYWAPILEKRSGEHPGMQLAAYDPDVEVVEEEIEAEETAVPPPIVTNSTTDEPEATITYIPGEPGDDQPQTLAQLFVTMPKAAKIVILVLIALILAAIIFWILSPKTDQPVEDTPGTETAVAAAITASAQPSRTPTATATPLMYIQSETAVVQSAPISSPTPIIHIVQTGDTLNSISRKYGIPVPDITALNNIYNPNSIAAGQELLIPTSATNSSVSSATNENAISQPEATAETTPIATSPNTTLELVIRSTEAVPLHIAAGSDYQSIADLTPGTFATVIAKTPDGIWYLIQLEDGFTRGWVLAEQTALLAPANADAIPTTPMP